MVVLVSADSTSRCDRESTGSNPVDYPFSALSSNGRTEAFDAFGCSSNLQGASYALEAKRFEASLL
jgi:hypothetical protein